MPIALLQHSLFPLFLHPDFACFVCSDLSLSVFLAAADSYPCGWGNHWDIISLAVGKHGKHMSLPQIWTAGSIIHDSTFAFTSCKDQNSPFVRMILTALVKWCLRPEVFNPWTEGQYQATENEVQGCEETTWCCKYKKATEKKRKKRAMFCWILAFS